ncbi:hypothetical protein LCGC14_2889320, partial [marine sediment metagenome]
MGVATGFEKLGIDARPSVRHEQRAQLELRGPAGRQQDVGRPGALHQTVESSVGFEPTTARLGKKGVAGSGKLSAGRMVRAAQ